jgi:hypothetical protein
MYLFLFFESSLINCLILLSIVLGITNFDSDKDMNHLSHIFQVRGEEKSFLKTNSQFHKKYKSYTTLIQKDNNNQSVYNLILICCTMIYDNI